MFRTRQQIFSDNLNRLMLQSETTQKALGDYIGVSDAAVNKWVNGLGTPRYDKLQKICDYFRIELPELTEAYYDKESKAIRIPVLGYVAGGIPLEMITDILDEEEIPASMVKKGQQYFALKIRGDSMSPKISDGDVVICLAQEDVESGQLAIVAVNGDQATCKRIKKYKDGIELIPSNPSHPTRFFTYEEVKKIPVHIIGRVVELRAKFD